MSERCPNCGQAWTYDLVLAPTYDAAQWASLNYNVAPSKVLSSRGTGDQLRGRSPERVLLVSPGQASREVREALRLMQTRGAVVREVEW